MDIKEYEKAYNQMNDEQKKAFWEKCSLNKKYYWVASSSDGSFEDNSSKMFDTKKECYDDMRNAVLEKMKWNTQFDEDFSDINEDDYIGYSVHFNQNYITHQSYSGLYTYEIKETYQLN